MRKFAKVKRVEEVELPKRSTKYSAGYDMFAPEDVVIEPRKIAIVKTGVKCYMNDDEFLMVCNRSSNPIKKSLVVMNGMGIIDSDYVDNPDNEGEIGFEFYNIASEPVIILKGEKLGQAIFVSFAKADDDNTTTTREGGFGSTGK